jgi:hypothetical protein
MTADKIKPSSLTTNPCARNLRLLLERDSQIEIIGNAATEKKQLKRLRLLDLI